MHEAGRDEIAERGRERAGTGHESQFRVSSRILFSFLSCPRPADVQTLVNIEVGMYTRDVRIWQERV